MEHSRLMVLMSPAEVAAFVAAAAVEFLVLNIIEDDDDAPGDANAIHVSSVIITGANFGSCSREEIRRSSPILAALWSLVLPGVV
jgi:hypothetical protein